VFSKTGGSVSVGFEEMSIITLKQKPYDEALLLTALRYKGVRQHIINYILRNICTTIRELHLSGQQNVLTSCGLQAVS
jgi:hypothetical protein